MKRVYSVIGFICCVIFAYSQENITSDIQIPATPGMSIIGTQNTEISKPGNYTGLYTCLISPIVSNNGTVPKDLSLEFSPYYLKSRDITSYEVNRTNLYRDLRISIASTNVTSNDSTKFSRMGIGFKTNLLGGNYTIKSNKEKDEITLAVANDINTVLFMIDVYGIVAAYDTLFSVERHEISKFIKTEVKEIMDKSFDNKDIAVEKLKALQKKVEESIVVDTSRWNYSLRTGSFLEFAGAISLDFPDNNFSYSVINRWGLWLSYTYRPKNKLGMFDFGAILRISNYSFDPTVIFENEALFGDIGASINIRIPESRFTLSGEWIGKFGFSDLKSIGNGNQYTFNSVTENKWNLSVGYQITKDIMWSMSLSEINGNSDYLKNNAMQLLTGISASLVPLKK